MPRLLLALFLLARVLTNVVKNWLCKKRSLTKRAPDAGDSGAIPSIFLRLSIFPVGRRSAARPSAGNANRWAFGEDTWLYPKKVLEN